MHFDGIKAAVTQLLALKQQYRDLQSPAAAGFRVSVDIDDLEPVGARRQQCRQFPDQPLAQMTVGTGIQLETRQHGQCVLAAAEPFMRTELAMYCTVCAGTSPIAVTSCPSTMVEKA